MPRFAANVSLLFPDRDPLDRFAAARAAGFDAVEIQFPYAWPAEVLGERIERSGLALVLLNAPAGDWDGGERGLACLPDRAADFRRGVEAAAAYARALRCPKVNVLAGLTPAGAEPREVRATLAANLRHAAAVLRDAGADLVVEALNPRDVPGFHLPRCRDVVEALDEAGLRGAALQLDSYHVHVTEGDVLGVARRFLPRVGHVQVADAPGRHEPGTGEIDFAAFFELLDRSGYAGWVGCEYRPAARTEDGLGWLERFRVPPAP
jgi:hydroxypyruvate isomerase